MGRTYGRIIERFSDEEKNVSEKFGPKTVFNASEMIRSAARRHMKGSREILDEYRGDVNLGFLYVDRKGDIVRLSYNNFHLEEMTEVGGFDITRSIEKSRSRRLAALENKYSWLGRSRDGLYIGRAGALYYLHGRDRKKLAEGHELLRHGSLVYSRLGTEIRAGSLYRT